jgi:hypothetical protein
MKSSWKSNESHKKALGRSGEGRKANKTRGKEAAMVMSWRS